jgi:hypothetical protein
MMFQPCLEELYLLQSGDFLKKNIGYFGMFV